MIGAFAPGATQAKGWRETMGWPFAPHPMLGRPLFGGSIGSRGGNSPQAGGNSGGAPLPPQGGGGGQLRPNPGPRPNPLIPTGARQIPRAGVGPVAFAPSGIGALSMPARPQAGNAANVPPGSRVSPSGIANPAIPAPPVNVAVPGPAPIALPRHPNFGRFNQMDGAETWWTDPGFHREPENEAYGGERPRGRPAPGPANDVVTRPPAYDAAQPGVGVGAQLGVRPGKLPPAAGAGTQVALGPPDQGLTMSAPVMWDAVLNDSTARLAEREQQLREIDEYNRRNNSSYSFYGVNTPEMYDALQRQSMATWGRASPLMLL